MTFKLMATLLHRHSARGAYSDCREMMALEGASLAASHWWLMAFTSSKDSSNAATRGANKLNNTEQF